MSMTPDYAGIPGWVDLAITLGAIGVLVLMGYLLAKDVKSASRTASDTDAVSFDESKIGKRLDFGTIRHVDPEIYGCGKFEPIIFEFVDKVSVEVPHWTSAARLVDKYHYLQREQPWGMQPHSMALALRELGWVRKV